MALAVVTERDRCAQAWLDANMEIAKKYSQLPERIHESLWPLKSAWESAEEAIQEWYLDGNFEVALSLLTKHKERCLKYLANTRAAVLAGTL